MLKKLIKIVEIVIRYDGYGTPYEDVVVEYKQEKNDEKGKGKS